jgi:endoglycosylceramidase
LWPGVEPQRGSYNETYLKLMQDIVTKAASYGIYTLIDMHQDSFSEKFCGEGVPAWAAVPSTWLPNFLAFPEPIAAPFPINNKTGYPFPSDCNKYAWSDYYFTIALSTAVQNLYSNFDHLRDSFAAYWMKLAKTWATSNAVIGYELMNEPWAGDIYEDPTLMVPGVADYLNLAPFYNHLNTAIRSVDSHHLIFFESVTWDDFITGFTEPPGGNEYCNRSVLSYHIYVPPNIAVPQAFETRMHEVKRLKVGGFLTEFDASGFSDSDTARRFFEVLDLADRYLQSWMGWEFKAFAPMTGWTYGYYYQNGSLKEPLVRALARTYAQAVAGSIQSMAFNNETCVFALVYNIKTSCTLPTVIYINQQWNYPNGFTVSISPSSAASWKLVQANTINIYQNPTVPDGTQLTVVISPA